MAELDDIFCVPSDEYSIIEKEQPSGKKAMMVGFLSRLVKIANQANQLGFKKRSDGDQRDLETETSPSTEARDDEDTDQYREFHEALSSLDDEASEVSELSDDMMNPSEDFVCCDLPVRPPIRVVTEKWKKNKQIYASCQKFNIVSCTPSVAANTANNISCVPAIAREADQPQKLAKKDDDALDQIFALVETVVCGESSNIPIGCRRTTKKLSSSRPRESTIYEDEPVYVDECMYLPRDNSILETSHKSERKQENSQRSERSTSRRSRRSTNRSSRSRSGSSKVSRSTNEVSKAISTYSSKAKGINDVMDFKQEVLKDVEAYRLKLLKAKTDDEQEPNRNDTPTVVEDASSKAQESSTSSATGASSVTSHTDTYAGLQKIGACVFAASTSVSTIDKESMADRRKESLADRGSVSSTVKEVESASAVESVSTKGQSWKEVLGFVIALITALRNVDRASLKPREVATKGFKFMVCMIFFLLWPSHVERKEVPRPPPPTKKVSLLHLVTKG
jgi:hypothetical protein